MTEIKPSIDDLPDELLARVFSHLNRDGVGRCAQVCRRWLAVASDRHVLWATNEKFREWNGTYFRMKPYDFLDEVVEKGRPTGDYGADLRLAQKLGKRKFWLACTVICTSTPIGIVLILSSPPKPLRLPLIPAIALLISPIIPLGSGFAWLWAAVKLEDLEFDQKYRDINLKRAHPEHLKHWEPFFFNIETLHKHALVPLRLTTLMGQCRALAKLANQRERSELLHERNGEDWERFESDLKAFYKSERDKILYNKYLGLTKDKPLSLEDWSMKHASLFSVL